MPDTRDYAFIDENYLRRAYEDTMRKFFKDVDHNNLDFEGVKSTLNASKVFYYDAIDDTLPDADDRSRTLDRISAIDGFAGRRAGTSATILRRARFLAMTATVGSSCAPPAPGREGRLSCTSGLRQETS